MESKKLLIRGLKFIFFFLISYSLTFFVLYRFKIGQRPSIYYTNDIYSLKGGNTSKKFNEFDYDSDGPKRNTKTKKKYQVILKEFNNI